jgi:hypothetical protein
MLGAVKAGFRGPDATVRVEYTRRPSNHVVYTVADWHDMFLAYELSVKAAAPTSSCRRRADARLALSPQGTRGTFPRNRQAGYGAAALKQGGTEMASWDELRNYIESNYAVVADQLDMLGLDFGLDNGRTQKVLIRRTPLDGAEWVQILTPVCEEGDIEPREALVLSGKMIVGGLVLLDETIYFRHSLPLKDLDTDEFDVPLHLAVGFGDRLEQEIVGVDRY